MWFNPGLEDAYVKGFEPALRETGFLPYRVDKVHSSDKIDDRILSEIRRSRLLVADCTGLRQSVYFEAGMAMGLGIDVVWTCRERIAGEDQDWVKNLPFDARQFQHLIWSTPDDLRQKLIDHIHGRGLERKRQLKAELSTPPL
jgi:hypothetical protein